MDATDEKIKKLQQNAESVRTGGKGTARRKKKVVHKTAATDDKKLQTHLKKLSVTTIPSIDEVNMICEDGSVIHFNVPKVQASIPSNTFSITGIAEKKPLEEMMPHILSQLGIGAFGQLQKLVDQAQRKNKADDGVPDLVGDIDFEEVAKQDGEASTSSAKPSKEQSLMDAVD